MEVNKILMMLMAKSLIALWKCSLKKSCTVSNGLEIYSEKNLLFLQKL